MTKKTNKVDLKIVFDTNALFTGVAHELVSNKTKVFIQKNSNYKDLNITWYIPEIVVLERQFRMIEAGAKFLPNIEKMELLLGHKLNINENIVKNRVKECIQNQIDNLNIVKQSLDTKTVDWNRIINDSVTRVAPFENNEKEKGFRDAIILETFSQIVEMSSQNPKNCRIILITDDKLLSEAANSRFTKIKNVGIIQNIEKCEEFIGLIDSEVTEEYIKSVKDKIALSFFNKDNQTGIYFDYNISEVIKENHLKELKQLPPISTIRENGTWYISPPTFSHKEGQKFFWVSKITVEGIGFKKSFLKKEQRFNLSDYLSESHNNSKILEEPFKSFHSPTLEPNLYSSLLTKYNKPLDEVDEMIEQKIKNSLCQTIFTVKWSIVIKTTGVYGITNVEEIIFIENNWQEV